MMIVNFIQFGTAVQLGACGADESHGFDDRNQNEESDAA